MPSLTTVFPSAEVARALRNVVCVGPEGRSCRFPRAEPRLHDRHRHAADRRLGRSGFPRAGQLPLRAGGIALGTRLRPARRSDRAALQRRRPGSRATTSRKARRSRSRSSARKARSKMSANSAVGESAELCFALRRSWRGCRWPSSCARRRIRGAPKPRAGRHDTCCGCRPVIGAADHRADVRARCRGRSARCRKRGTPSCGGCASSPISAKTNMCWRRWPCLLIAVASSRRPCAESSGRCCSVSERACSFCSSRCCVRLVERSDQMVRRPRPAVCRRRSQRLQLLAFRRQPRPIPAFHPGTPRPLLRWPSPSPRYGRRRGWRWLVYASDHCGHPPRAAGASSERRGRRRAGRDRSARCSCDTGLRPAGSDLRSSATAPLCPLVGPSSGRLKRVARGAFAP